MKLRALLFSIAAAALTAALLVLYLQRLEIETSGGAPVRVLVATQPLTPGTLLTAEMLTTRSVPLAYVEPRAVRESEMNRVVGLKIETSVKPQHTLMWTDLAVTTDDRRQLSALVQPGMRAVSIRSLSDGRHSALIRPGDRVDVVGNLPIGERDRVAVLVAQNLLVLGVGLDLGGDAVNAQSKESPLDRNELVLTVSANVQQLQQLSLAAEKGRLMVGLRNPDDTRNLEAVANMPFEALFEKTEKPRAIVVQGPQLPVALTK